MRSSFRYSDWQFKRIRLFGVIFVVIGLCFIAHGGLNLIESYNRPVNMFALEEGLSPEKGRMWSEFLAGMSVSLMGMLMVIKTAMDMSKGEKSESSEN